MHDVLLQSVTTLRSFDDNSSHLKEMLYLFEGDVV